MVTTARPNKCLAQVAPDAVVVGEHVVALPVSEGLREPAVENAIPAFAAKCTCSEGEVTKRMIRCACIRPRRDWSIETL